MYWATVCGLLQHRSVIWEQRKTAKSCINRSERWCLPGVCAGISLEWLGAWPFLRCWKRCSALLSFTHNGQPSDTGQTNTSNMGQMLAENLSKLLALNFLSQPLPTCVTISDCCGLSEMEIKNRYKSLNVLPGTRPGEAIIEARDTGKTLSFRMQNGLCLAGYCFDDKEDF